MEDNENKQCQRVNIELLKIKGKENENLKEVVEKISEDEKMQRIIELREKAIRDKHAIYLRGVDVGIEKKTAKEKTQIAIQ